MKPITYTMQFRGRVTSTRVDHLHLKLSAPSSALVTTIGPEGVRGTFEELPGGEAILESELSLGEQSTFDDSGTSSSATATSSAFAASKPAPSPPPQTQPSDTAPSSGRSREETASSPARKV